MPGHRATVADEDVVPASVELESSPPRQFPALVVDHRPDVRHFFERRHLQHTIVAGREKGTPAGEVARRRPELAHRTGAAEIGVRLEPDGVTVRLDKVAARCRSGRVRRRAPESERVEHPLCSASSQAAAVRAGDDLAEEREGEVRVVPPGAGLEHLLRVGGAAEQLLAGRHLHRFPDLARRLALEPGGVREHAPERRARVRFRGDISSADRRARAPPRRAAGGLPRP